MINSRRSGESDRPRRDRRVEQSVVAIVVICVLLFVDVQIPLFGSSTRLIAVSVFLLLLFGAGGIRTPFCATMFVLLSLYILVPIIFRPDGGVFSTARLLIDQMLSLGGMVLLARVLASDDQRRKLTDVLVLFALVSAAVAFFQRLGILGQLGRDRWAPAGYSITASGDLRGAAFLADPNFFAILLASVVPLIVSWRFTWLRAPALAVLALGLYSTNSRAGICLAALALALSILTRTSTTNAGVMAKGRKSVTLVATCLVALFAFNFGGQRDRAVQAFLIAVGVDDGVGTGHGIDAFVARERRGLLEDWIHIGMDNLPFGVGMGTRVDVPNAAHNTFVTLLGQGGIFGVAVGLTSLACLVVFVRRLREPFAIMGLVIVLGGLTLSYPGAVFLLLPMGLADGILAARLGTRPRPASESPPSQFEPGGSPATRHVDPAR